MPVVVEIIDETEKVETFFETIKPYLDVVPKGCVVTMEPVRVVFSKSGTK